VATAALPESGAPAPGGPERLALELKGITKRFGPVTAVDRVDLDLRPGEVHALLGENGAGKSTLMNVLYGLYRPDEGEIRIRGALVEMSSPGDAIAQGIGMVHQHFMLIPVMTVAENIVLAAEPRHAGALLDAAAARQRVRDISERFGLAVEPDAYVHDITVGQQQRVEILKALYRRADILILDEPTAVLTPQEAQELGQIVRSLTKGGASVIFISHKLHEVREFADRVTVIRRGKRIETFDAAGVDERTLAERMVGREVVLTVDKDPRTPGEPLLEVEDLVVLDDRDLEAVRGVSLTARAGEIVGIAGVDGNGQTELIDAITGLRHVRAGRIRVQGKDIANESPHEILHSGIGHIPTDRQHRGLILDFSLAENVAIHDFDRPPASRHGWLFPKRIRDYAAPLLGEFDLRGCDENAPASSLSGGNQQKVIIAREVSRDPMVLVAGQPTRGLDVGAIEYVHRRLVAERDEGRAVVLVSLELDEILSLSDRILVMSEGRIVAEFTPDVTREELGMAMLGTGEHGDGKAAG
jgi:general nucleoside transport system ATP-binding protein